MEGTYENKFIRTYKFIVVFLMFCGIILAVKGIGCAEKISVVNLYRNVI